MPKSGFNDGHEKPVSVKNDLRNVIMKDECVQLLMASLLAHHEQKIYFQPSAWTPFHDNVGG